MVKSMLYCSEQIAIPETFPNILKTYAKAAIRTQPYDLLRWSAAYFRCLANDVPPPVKQRLEKECRHGSLTKGYLKVLLDQVGKGYFISRRVLQKRWAALCLPEEELLKYLSLCRMLNWPQVHWLKLFAVMAGSLNETPLCTMNMICELLSDDVEGGRSRIPIWVFRVCYTFVAELDCSEEQSFINGRKKLPSGDLEEEKRMEKVPQVLSATSLRQAIFDECTHRYNTDCQCNAEQFESGRRSGEPTIRQSSSTSISSGFQFMGDISEPMNMLRKYNDFDSLILLLREAQGAVLHDYEGPSKVTQKQIEHAKLREQEIMEAKERQAQLFEDNAKKFIFQEKLNMLKEIGPPWSWLHEFAADSCMDKSYNFIEEQSIISDATPSESSDESFDFCNNKQTYDNFETKHSRTSLTDSSSEHVSELLRENDNDVDSSCSTNDPLNIIQTFLKDAEKKGEITAHETPSVVTFLCKEEFGVLKGAGRTVQYNIDVGKIVDSIQAADRRGIQFETIDEMMDYLKEMKDKEELYLAPLKKIPKEEIVGEEEGEEEITTELGFPEEETELLGEEEIDDIEKKNEFTSYTDKKFDDGEEQFENEEEMELERSITSSKHAEKIVNIKSAVSLDKSAEEISAEPSSGSRATIESIEDKNEGPQNVDVQIERDEYNAIDEIKEDEERLPMSQIFADSGTLPDEFKMETEGSCTILGLMDKPEEEEEEEALPEEETSEISGSGTVSGCGNISDVSSKYLYSEKSEDYKKRHFNAYTCPHSESSESLCSVSDGFCCTIPAYHGIGGTVSKKTIQDFLTYLKMRSRAQSGMIMPTNFKEEKCPRMIDCCNL